MISALRRGHQRRWAAGSLLTRGATSAANEGHALEYDLVCIGSGPSAVACAVDSAKRGKKVALVERPQWLGGVCIHSGTIPSKTFREAVLFFTRHRHASFGKPTKFYDKQIALQDVIYRVNRVIETQTETVHQILSRNKIELLRGTAEFVGLNELLVAGGDGDKGDEQEKQAKTTTLRAHNFFIGVGTTPTHRSGMPIDGERIFDTDQFHTKGAKDAPRHMVVIGAGVLGLEYASMVNILPGSNVTIIDSRTKLLDFADREMVAFLMHVMRENGARFLLGETVTGIKKTQDAVLLTLASGKSLFADLVLYTPGRKANTEGLHLEKVGVATDAHGLIAVNSNYQTEKTHIYAGGDCIGFPALASTSNEQGRLASIHMWEGIEPRAVRDSQLVLNNFPYGVYTVPEMSMVGRTEEELTKMNIRYEVGTANFNELAKAQMLGGNAGLLKLIFDPKTLELYGVHVVGEGATEIVHIGQAAIAMKTTIEFFRDAVFNYPTLAEAYRVAALDGLGKVRRS